MQMDPVTREENVILRLKLSKFVQTDDGVDEVVLSRFNNAINELRKGKVVSSFSFQECITVAQQLEIFFSYEPKFKHYLFMNGSDLIILRKTENVFKLINVYKKVTNFVVADNFNSGKPQVIIHGEDQEPIITDCISEKSDHPIRTQVQAFAPYLQKSKMRIKNTEKVLQEKTKMISKLSNMLAFNCDSSQICTSIDRLVFLKEGLSNAFTGLPNKGNTFSIGDPWYKIHLGQWVIGFPVVNITENDLFSFEMYISSHGTIVRKTVLFTKSSKTEDIDLYQKSFKLRPKCYGVLVAVMQEPPLMLQSYVLNCVCRFEDSSSEESQQCYLGSIEIMTTSLRANENYPLLSSHLSFMDLVTIQAASKLFELHYHSSVSTAVLLNMLESLRTLKRIADNVFINSRTCERSSCFLLIVDSNRCKISTFLQEVNDFLLLIHKLRDIFGETVLFKHSKSDPSLVLENTMKEIKYVKGLTIQEIMDNESRASPTQSVGTVDAFRDMMLMETDSISAMNSLKMYP